MPCGFGRKTDPIYDNIAFSAFPPLAPLLRFEIRELYRLALSVCLTPRFQRVIVTVKAPGRARGAQLGR